MATLRQQETGGSACADCRGDCIVRCADRCRTAVAAGADRLSGALGVGGVAADLARLIDHTLLKPDATEGQVRQLCHEARQHNFATVCVNPTWVRLCAELLQGAPVLVCTVVGFPLGATLTAVKVYEAEQAIALGACELDMVINVGALKSKDYRTVEQDIDLVARACHERGAILKVIIEAVLLNDEEKVEASVLAQAAGAEYVKTSTGFGPGGATVADVSLMRRVVGSGIGVKAAGGIRSLTDAQSMIQAGATRVGASAGVKIVQEASAKRP
ncbi:MAG: deoxyribose-phosphate aldolase [Anaerolineae bacterium]|nr:deoxyribose-phosphate aldolase [Anaerolineae bacterium]